MELNYGSLVALWCKQYGDEPTEDAKTLLREMLVYIQVERMQHPERSKRSILKDIITALEQRQPA